MPLLDPSEAVAHYSASSAEERGAVFTRREVVEFILDLTGYTVDVPLHKCRLLEPSFGAGDFLLPAMERLIESYASHVTSPVSAVDDLSDAIRAVEVHSDTIAAVRAQASQLLQRFGVTTSDADKLAERWLIQADFLLVDLPHDFTHIVANPPYVRQEQIPEKFMAEYRGRYSTIYDRADLYIPFIERCLTSLTQGGALGSICADRWMKNKYGGPLREMIASGYHLAAYIDMVDTPAFHSEVNAYPAITVIRRESPGPTRVAVRPSVDRETLSDLSQAFCSNVVPEGKGVVEVSGVVKNREPWILNSLACLPVVRRLEAEFPVLEDAGCNVGIGVATGADKVFIARFDDLDVEDDRKLPLVRTKDIQDGTVKWQGMGVINPFGDDGMLVSLADYPRLANHFETHAEVVRKRNCAKRNPNGWYRTIDRIYPELTHRPKLLIPDIKGDAHIVYEDGHLYPHHNLYFITSDEWDLRALQTVLQSGIASLFVSVYSTQMRGGYLRFQAQYLRRIRLPRWRDVSESARKALLVAAEAGDREACNQAAFELYRLTPEEQSAIASNGRGNDE